MLATAVMRQSQRHKKAIFCKKMAEEKDCGQLPERKSGMLIQMPVHCRPQLIQVS
jgi:hypothetical protein